MSQISIRINACVYLKEDIKIINYFQHKEIKYKNNISIIIINEYIKNLKKLNSLKTTVNMRNIINTWKVNEK